MTRPRLFPRRGLVPALRVASTANVAPNSTGWSIVRGADLANPATTGNEVRLGGWERHPVVNACVRVIVDQIAPVGFEVYRKDGNGESVLPNHEALALLEAPSGPLSPYRLRARTAVQLLLYGNSFWYLDRGRARRGLPRALRVVHPERVTYAWVGDAEQIVRYDWRDVNGATMPSTPAEDMVHFRDLEARDGFFGYPRLAAALLDIDSDTKASQYTRQMLSNHGVPGMVVLTEGVTSIDDLRQAEASWHEKMTTRGERGRTKFLAGVKDVKPIGFDLSELEFPDLRGIARESICAAAGVDPRMIGLQSAATDAGLSGQQYREARARLIQQTCLPIMRAIESELNTWLMPEYGDVYVRFSPDAIAEMLEDKGATSTRVIAEVGAGVRTVEEARQTLDLDETMDPTHTLTVPSSVTFATVAVTLAEAAKTPADRAKEIAPPEDTEDTVAPEAA